MKRLFALSPAVLLSLVLLSLVCACSSPTKKVEKIIADLPSDSHVVYSDLIGDNKEVITVSPVPGDSMVCILSHSLAENRTDTISRFHKEFEVVEVVPADKDYIVVYRVPRSDGNCHFLYGAFLFQNIEDNKKATATTLNVDEKNTDIMATSYHIDKNAGTITLESYNVDSKDVTLYHIVYDFKGNQMVNDPVKIKLNSSSESAGSSLYRWECEGCGLKRTSSTKPKASFLDDCPAYGFHRFVKISKIE
ncbi:MAG: hypothetical protein K2M88_07480 [Muribaculaceae bacterium]|nr:hypothetical protein [Muribaculaceae bacterium]